MPASPLLRVRKLCLAFPEAHEAEAWGEPTFRVRNKLFAMYASAGNHHGRGRQAVWCKCAPANQQLLISSDPGRYFAPPYVGPSGWVGVYLDGKPDWAAVAELLRDGYCMIAPARLRAQLREP
ncbi:MAG: MmcQ/YjbR family DNA-binding protein [Gemmatimonadaceae bacterium]